MAEFILIKRPNGVVTMVRSKVDVATESPITEHEQIIGEFYNKIKGLNLSAIRKRAFLRGYKKGFSDGQINESNFENSRRELKYG